MHEASSAVVDRYGRTNSYEDNGIEQWLGDKVINHYDVSLFASADLPRYTRS